MYKPLYTAEPSHQMGFLQNIQLTPTKNLLTDVEHRRVFTLQQCELNIFETYRTSERVALTFHDTVITSMVRGKKVMHMPDMPAFDYYPGETVLAPADTQMVIDFPLAQEQDPTQCIALTLDRDTISQTLEYINYKYPRIDTQWDFQFGTAHLKNSAVLAEVINKIVSICTEKNMLAKDVLADLTLKELIVRLMQLQNLQELLQPQKALGHDNRFARLVQHIRTHLHDKLDVTSLARMACMSRPHFFRAFKREYGVSPVQFIIKERLKKAKALLADTNLPVQTVGLETGFDDVNNFIKTFKKLEGVTPGGYRMKVVATA